MATEERLTAAYLLIVTAFTACVPLTVLLEGAEADLGLCEPKANTSRRWSFTLARVRNESGQWVEFTSTTEMDDEYAVQVTQQLFACGGRKMIRLQGALKDPFYGDILEDRVKFHHMTGPNTALINNGFTVVKLKLDGHGTVLTGRPMRTGEMFEVRMDKRATTKNEANGIGVTTRKPEDGLPEHMNTFKYELTSILFQIYSELLGANLPIPFVGLRTTIQSSQPTEPLGCPLHGRVS